VVSELAAQLPAARRQETGGQRRVVVRGEIQVVGHFQLETVVSGMAEAREQEAALAFVAHGKGDVGRVENGHVLEAHGHVARSPFLRLGVDVERGGLQHPVLVADRAGGIAHIGQRQFAVRKNVDVRREAATVSVHELEVRLVEVRRAVDVVAP
jgi:hypothetical protein